MGTREKDKRLQEIYDSGGETFSISRLNTVAQCEYQAYLHYIVGIPDESNIWAILGGKVHDVIEGCILGTHKPSDMRGAIDAELDDAAMMGIDFPRTSNGSDAIRRNYIANMHKFAEVFSTPKGKFDTEQLAIFPIGDKQYMIGYIDAMRYNADGTVSLIDWKTSSAFKGGHLLEAGRQLIVYTLALEKAGLKVRDTQWCMLKYAITKYPGNTRGKVSEWRNLIKDLYKPIMTALEAAGYDDFESNVYYDMALDANSFRPLPEVVRDKFHTSIYVRKYDITPELIAECKDYIARNVARYEDLKTCHGECGHRDINGDPFFCTSLCGLRNHCKYYKEYVDGQKSDDDIFG